MTLPEIQIPHLFRSTAKRRRRSAILFITLLSVLLPLVAGCTRSTAERQEIERVAELRSQALTTKNLDLYVSLISRNYQDKGKDFTAKKQELANTFHSFDRVEYRSWNRDIRINGDQATISADYDLRITVKGSPLALSGRETLVLRREAGGWKIVGGL